MFNHYVVVATQEKEIEYMPKMTRSDFDYLRKKIYADKSYHEEQFLRRINPDMIDKYYESDPTAAWEETTPQYAPDRMTLNKLYPATMTFLGQVTPRNPKFVCTTTDDKRELDTKITEGALNHYFKEMKAVRKDTLAILASWFYGFGVTKQGWRVERGTDPAKIDETEPPEGSIVGKIAGIFTGSPKVEEKDDNDYILSEGPFLDYVSCKDVYFDKDASIFDIKYFTQHVKKNLQELQESGIYTLDEDFYRRFRKGKDLREVKMDLYEQWNWQKDGMYVFVMADGYDEPLRYDKIPYASEGFPFKTLRFNLQPDKTYMMPSMKIAQRQQKLYDYILTLQKETIEKFQDVTIWDSEAFDAQDRERIKKNEIGTNVFTKQGKQPMATCYKPQSTVIPKDLFAIQNLMDQNMREIFSVVGAVGGQNFDTATQEKIGAMGNQIRSMGFAMNVRDFIYEQGMKLKQDLKQFGTMTGTVKISGVNIKDPSNGQYLQDQIVEFGTINSPKMLKDIIPQDIDMDVDLSEGLNQDKAIIRKQMMEFVSTVIMPLKPLLDAEGTKFNATEFAKKIAGNFEVLGNIDQYFEKSNMPLAPMAGMQIPPQVPAIGQAGIPTVSPVPAGPAPSPNVVNGPTPESILQGIVQQGRRI